MFGPTRDPSSDDGWTHVAPRRKHQPKPRAQLPPRSALPSVDRNLKIDALAQDFHRKTRAWQQSACRAQALRALDRGRPATGWRVRIAVGLALGSFSVDALALRQRSMWQLVVFDDLLAHLGASVEEEQGSKRLKAVAQDPRFSALDREFLESRGYEVTDAVESRDGLQGAERYIGSECFLYEPFMDLGVSQVEFIVEADPSIYLGSSFPSRYARVGKGGTGVRDRSPEAEKEAGMVKAFMEGRHMTYFPTFEPDPNAFDGLAILWRDDDDDENVEGESKEA